MGTPPAALPLILLLAHYGAPAFAGDGCSLSVHQKIAQCPKTTGTGLCTQESLDSLVYDCQAEYDEARAAFVMAETAGDVEKAGARMKEVTSKIEQMRGLSFPEGSAVPIIDEESTIVPVRYSVAELPAEIARRIKYVQTPMAQVVVGEMRFPSPGPNQGPKPVDNPQKTSAPPGKTTGPEETAPPKQRGGPESDADRGRPDADSSSPRERSGSGPAQMPGGSRVGEESREKLDKSLDRARSGAGSWEVAKPEAGGDGRNVPGKAGEQAKQALAGSEKPAAMDLANPKSRPELILAAVGPFKGAAQALGLKIGAGPGGPTLFGPDGKAATAQAYQALADRIQGEPQALLRRPDFFDVLPRESFDAIKDRYNDGGQARDTFLRHIAVTPPADRDMLWSQSCDYISGDCNRYVDARSYRRGDFVSPEDLRRIAESMRDLSKEDQKGRTGDASDKLASRIPKGLRSKVLGVLSASFKFLKGIGGALPGASKGATVYGGDDPEREWGPRQPVAFTGKPTRPRTRPGSPPHNAASPRASGWGWLVAAAVFVLVWLVYWRKRRRESHRAANPSTREADS